MVFHDTGVDAVAAGFEAFEADLPEQAAIPDGERGIAGGVTFGQSAAEDAERGGEGEPVGIEVRLVRGCHTQRLRDEVPQRERVEFLHDAGRRSAAEGEGVAVRLTRHNELRSLFIHRLA